MPAASLRTRPRVQAKSGCSCGGLCPACRDAPEPAVVSELGLMRQPTLRVSGPDDAYEREADAVADRVMRMADVDLPAPGGPGTAPGQTIMRQPTEDREEEELQAKRADGASAVGADATATIGRLKGDGRPLSEPVRAFFEPRIGADFSQVRIHDGAAADTAASAVGARAFTLGRDIAFARGEFSPGTTEGQRLLAHELAHVVQQGGSDAGGPSRALLQRKPKPGTAGAAPKLELVPSAKKDPCACLVVIHNDERNARENAKWLHGLCRYNMLLREPDDKNREITLPGHGAKKFDPNALFPAHIAEKCEKDEAACRQTLRDKKDSKDKSDIQEFVQIQFFLAVKDCSNGFRLPVVALHNNRVNDTKEYRGKLASGLNISDLQGTDIDKTDPADPGGKKQLDKLKKAVDKKVSAGARKLMMETKKKTNIFRWCNAKDLSRCHIGDPKHPDNVVWVTNKSDFERLRKKPVNVVLQSDLASSKGSASEGDLSTLFLILADFFGKETALRLKAIEARTLDNIQDVIDIIEHIEELAKFEDLTLKELSRQILQILIEIIDILEQLLIWLLTAAGGGARIAGLRYLNIETPGIALDKSKDPERERNRDAIVAVLKATGLHCCDGETSAATPNAGGSGE